MSQTSGAVSVRVPAKINLQLAVGPLRGDGFHEIATVFAALELHDVVTAAAADELSLTVRGAEATGLPADRDNLAWRAAELLARHAGIAARAELSIDKHIPVAAGLAGGSADAAATLLACDRLWGLDLPAGQLAELAAELGSDVAFALLGGTAVGAGRGERLRPVDHAASFWWVLAAADGGLSTPAVYAELDRLRASDLITADPSAVDQSAADPSAADPLVAVEAGGVLDAVLSGDSELLAGRLSNDLQPAAIALAPYLADTLAAGQKCGALAGIVSGSGPTCAFLARDAEHARELAQGLTESGSCRNALAVAGGRARPIVRG